MSLLPTVLRGPSFHSSSTLYSSYHLLHLLPSWLLSLQREDAGSKLNKGRTRLNLDPASLENWVRICLSNVLGSCWTCTSGGRAQLWKMSIIEKPSHVTPIIFQEEGLCGTEHELISSPFSDGCSKHRWLKFLYIYINIYSSLQIRLCVHIHIYTLAHNHQRELCWGYPFPTIPPISSSWLLLTYPLSAIPWGSSTTTFTKNTSWAS